MEDEAPVRCARLARIGGRLRVGGPYQGLTRVHKLQAKTGGSVDRHYLLNLALIKRKRLHSG